MTLPAKYITVQQAEAYASQAGFSNALVPKSKYAPGNLSQIQTIVGIAGAESGLNVNAENDSDPNGGSWGILQINGIHFYIGGTTKQNALDPLKAFQYAYTLSAHGTRFTDWSTFTNQAYLAHIPNIGQSSSLPQTGWWQYPHDYSYGQFPDPQGNYHKPDVNVQVPYNYPIAASASGVVTGINAPNGGGMPSYGATVTIKLDTPVNKLATHLAFIHLVDVTARLNQKVTAETIVGHAGDAGHAAGSAPAPLGVALTNGDYYGFGTQWQYNANGDPNLNPSPYIDSLAGGGTTPYTPLVQTNTSVTDFATALANFTSSAVQLTPDSSVVAVFEVMDSVTTLINPVSAIQVDNANPFQWIPDFLYFVLIDIPVLILRGFILFLGIYICFKVINNFINITGTVEKAANVGVNVAKLAALA